MHRAGLLQLLRRQGLPWLAWLCLLLPLAQGAATAHELSHLARNGPVQASQRADDGLLAHGDLCELCLAGAALGHGAPAPLALQLPLAAGTQADPVPPAQTGLPAAPAAAYQSRSPPASLR